MTSHHITSRHITSRHVTSRHIISPRNQPSQPTTYVISPRNQPHDTIAHDIRAHQHTTERQPATTKTPKLDGTAEGWCTHKNRLRTAWWPCAHFYRQNCFRGNKSKRCFLLCTPKLRNRLDFSACVFSRCEITRDLQHLGSWVELLQCRVPPLLLLLLLSISFVVFLFVVVAMPLTNPSPTVKV